VPVSVRAPMKFVDRVKTFPQLLEDRGYRWFILAEACCVAARIGTPFYILYAQQSLGPSGTVIGELSLAYLGADTASNLLWGNLGDRTGYRSTFVLAAAIWAAAIVLLLSVHHPWAVFVAFCGLGAGASGYQMSQQTMVLEFGERADIAMRLALSTTIEGTISAIGPILGGLIAWRYGYPLVLWLSFGFLGAAVLLLIFRVREPRNRHAEPVLEGDLPNPESMT
jgi:MFS family permease